PSWRASLRASGPAPSTRGRSPSVTSWSCMRQLGERRGHDALRSKWMAHSSSRAKRSDLDGARSRLLRRFAPRNDRAGAAILLVVIGALPAAADWTQFRGDAALTGVATDALPAAPALAWTFEAGEEVQSTPAIAGGTVYVGSKDGRLYALDLATGKQRFR